MEMRAGKMVKKNKNGWLMMPLVETLPEMKSIWSKTTCPVCGRPCWKRRGDEETIRKMNLEGAVCTECANEKVRV